MKIVDALLYHKYGYPVKEIGQKLYVSISTIYNYIKENYYFKRFPILEKEIKHTLLQGYFKVLRIKGKKE